MSFDDMRHIEKLQNKKSSKSSSSNRASDDDVPLALTRAQSSSTPQRTSTPKKSNIDWFDFFLSAGCDVDDCSRYAASFEKDKIDETLLPDITESTMRTLGLREGDILRVTKAIERRKPESPVKSTAQAQDQIRRDEELARQLQAQETGGSSPRSPAPNLFAGPGGVLKAPRRRPQPTKSLPPSVDINALSSAPSTPQITGTTTIATPSAPVQPPARASSVALPASGFEDDAWTNRPSSTKPVTGTPPSTTPRAPSAPPTSGSTVSAPTAAPLIAATPTPPPQSNAISVPATTIQTSNNTSSSLAKTTDADIFDQLARLSELRKPATPTPAVPSPTRTPAGYHAGLGMGSSTLPIGQHLQNQQLQSQQPILVSTPLQPQIQTQPLNGPRGPFAPVPVNQSLLQPLIPTQTGFSGFVPTRPVNINTTSSVTLTSLPVNPHPLLSQQLTGIPNQSLLPQTTGVSFGGYTPSTFQSSGNFGPTQPPIQPRKYDFCYAPLLLTVDKNTEFTGFNPNVGPSVPNNFTLPPVPPLPISVPNSNGNNNTSPANVFAQMKSGTFANEDHTQPQSSGSSGQYPA